MDYKVIQQKRLREYILKGTRQMHPESISIDVLQKLLVSAGRHIPIETIMSNVRYLEEKGYLSVKEVKIPFIGGTEVFIKITVEGIDLLEGSIQDKALNMEE